MRARVEWTESLDLRLRELRWAGQTWDAIALAMGLSRNTVLERARRIGARQRGPMPARSAVEPVDRLPRQAGHPISWAVLTEATVLAGTPYPYPVFL